MRRELFAGRRTIVANVFPSGADAVAAAAIGVPAGVLGEAAERLHEAAHRSAEQLVDEGVQLAKRAGLAAEERVEATAGSNGSALERIADEEDALAIVVGTRGLSRPVVVVP